MEFNYQDKGNYFRGLLILIGKDNVIGKKERQKILEITNRLGFDPKFCDEAVTGYLENEYIDNRPPRFSSPILTKEFLMDAINLSLIDNELHTEELEWIKSVAKNNDIDGKWLDSQLQNYVTDLPAKKISTSTNNLAHISN